jgi:hypothetical protein
MYSALPLNIPVYDCNQAKIRGILDINKPHYCEKGMNDILNLVSGNATKHIVGDNINVTKHYVGSMVRFDTLFCRDIESFLLF